MAMITREQAATLPLPPSPPPPDEAERAAEAAFSKAEIRVGVLLGQQTEIAKKFEAAGKKADLAGMKALKAQKAEIAEQILAARIALGYAELAWRQIQHRRLPDEQPWVAALDEAREAAKVASNAAEYAAAVYQRAQSNLQIAQNLSSRSLGAIQGAMSRLDDAKKAAVVAIAAQP